MKPSEIIKTVKEKVNYERESFRMGQEHLKGIRRELKEQGR